MIFFINDIPDTETEELKLSEDFLLDLNNGEYILHDDLESAKLEAKLCVADAWSQLKKPIYTYRLEANDNNTLISIEKVGELFVVEES